MRLAPIPRISAGHYFPFGGGDILFGYSATARAWKKPRPRKVMPVFLFSLAGVKRGGGLDFFGTQSLDGPEHFRIGRRHAAIAELQDIHFQEGDTDTARLKQRSK